MTRQGNRKKGFTTWELVIIVLMIALLAIVAVPNYQDYAGKARVNNAISIQLNPVEKALKKMPWGSVAFNSPKILGYGQTEVVQLLLSGNKTGSQLLSLIDEEGRKETYRVRFNNDMEAHLVGTAFDITPITQERQAVSNTGVAEWKWQVRAKEIGDQRLFLTLSAHLEINDRDAQHTVDTFSKTINVKVIWPQSAKYFLWNYWQWLCTAVAIPILGWVGSRIFRRKKSEKTNDQQGDQSDDPTSSDGPT